MSRTAPRRAGHQGDQGPASRSTSTAPARASIATGVGFYDHMLNQLARHGGFDLTVQHRGRPGDRRAPHDGGHRARARRGVRARRSATRPGIRRYGDAIDPDGRGAGAGRRRPVRPAVRGARRAARSPPYIGPVYPTSMTRHIFESFGHAAKVTLHVSVLRAARPGSQPDAHHVVEAQFKAVARALREAVAIDPRTAGARAVAPRACCEQRRADRCCSRSAGVLVGGAWSLHRQGAAAAQRRRSSACWPLLALAGGVALAAPGRRLMRPRVVVLDYGSGNLRSAERALARAGADVTVTADLAAAAARRRARRARRRRVRRRAWPASTRSAPGRSSPSGSPPGGRCSASASACRSCSSPATSTAWSPRGSACCPAAVTRLAAPSGCRTWAGTRSTAPAGSALFAGLRAGRAVLLRPLVRGLPAADARRGRRAA